MSTHRAVAQSIALVAFALLALAAPVLAHDYECFPSRPWECQCNDRGRWSWGFCTEMPGAAALVTYEQQVKLDRCMRAKVCTVGPCRARTMHECVVELSGDGVRE